MNREYKFRVWLKKEKKMVVPLSINLEKKQILFNEPSDKHWTEIRIVSFDDIELLQYTGINDKYGTEIYDGDIVKCKIGNVDFKGYVYFYGGRFEFIDFEDDEETEFLCYCDELEVIDTIYEYKELLEND